MMGYCGSTCMPSQRTPSFLLPLFLLLPNTESDRERAVCPTTHTLSHLKDTHSPSTRTHTPPPSLTPPTPAHTHPSLPQPDGLSTLLSSLRSLGCVLTPGLLGAASDVAVANMGSFSVASTIELLQVGGAAAAGVFF